MLRKQIHTSAPINEDLFTVTEAADFLGVHAATIRRWAYAKKLSGLKIGLRGDWRFTLNDLNRMSVSNTVQNTVFSQNQPVELESTTQWKDLVETSHFVQFYEEESFLIDSIQEYIESADAMIVIASKAHNEKIRVQLDKSGFQKKQGSECILLDAQETLDSISVDGRPDAQLFDEVIGKLMAEVVSRHKKVRAFGEMVAMLWEAGNQEGALYLEELWNELQKKYRFTLCCAYPIKLVGGSASSLNFADVCTQHSHVLPAESYAKLETADDRFRQIAQLQQKAFSLEEEIAERQKTEAKLLRAVEALKASEEFNRRIIENSADCIKVLDIDGRILQMNEPGRRLFEIESVDQLIGQNYSTFWKNGHTEDVAVALEAAKSGGVGRFQGLCPTAKGTPKWWDVVISPMFDDTGSIEKLLAISRDITAIKELEQRKEDFLSSTSHELKTPLTSQKAFVQLLQRQLQRNNDQEYSRYVTKIGEQTDKLAKLVTDLLDVTKIQSGKLLLNLRSIDLQTCIEEAIEEIKETSHHTIQMTGKIKKNIRADQEKISQVVFNLLTNAIKYSPASSTVEVILHQDAQQTRVSVKDSGIGIELKDQERIFDRFYRVSGSDEKTYPGMGMGLFIASEIIKQHGGTLKVDSAKGIGSTFTFILPQ